MHSMTHVALRNLRWASVVGLLVLAACERSKSASEANPTTQAELGPLVRVYEDIDEDTVWSSSLTYVLPQFRSIFVRDGATLTIEAGTTVLGETSSALIVTRGSRLEALGEPSRPIVFTSARPVSERQPGDWGGLVLLGQAPINTNRDASPPSDEAVLDVFPDSVTSAACGGSRVDDTSGILHYVRVEFGGFEVNPGKAFANLILCGVGNATLLDYVQVHRGDGVGLRIDGGAVDIKHIVSSQNTSDGIQMSHGWQGRGQFIVVQQLGNQSDTARGASAYHISNHHSLDAAQVEPRTAPLLYNATLVGPLDDEASRALVFDLGGAGVLTNHLLTGFAASVEFRSVPTRDALDMSVLRIENTVISTELNQAGRLVPEFPSPQRVNDIDERSYFEQFGLNNRVETRVELDRMRLLEAPVFVSPQPPYVGATPPDDGFFDPNASFIGAMGDDDWTKGLTDYPQPP